MTVKVEMHIREVRKAKGMTIAELSRISGVSKSYISEVETGKKMVTIQVLCLLAGSLGVKPEELYTYTLKK